MSVIALQVGQAGVQAGTQLFQLLAGEAALDGGSGAGSSHSEAWSPTADRFFYLASVGGQTRPTARAVLVDTEPSAVVAAHAAQRSAWQYSRAAAAIARPAAGTGGCWAAGALGAGPALCPEVLGMLRRQAERCDTLTGFLLLQGLAGGTGAGVGSALAAALRDEYPSAHLLGHCFWPLESSGVALQPYNTLLGLSSLAEHASGVVLTENEALAATCQKLLGIQRPTWADLNAVSSRSLAALLMPCSQQQAPAVAAPSAAQGRGRGRGRPAWDSAPPQPPPATAGRQQGPEGAGWDGTFGSGSRWEDDAAPPARGAFDPLAEACRLCSSAPYRLLTLRCGPTLPPSTFDFTPFSWPAALTGLRDAQQAGAAVEGAGGLGARRGGNKALASLLVLRGDQAAAADVGCLADAALYSSARQHASPLAVAASPKRLGGQQMLAALLSNDQTPVAPLSRMLDRARLLYDARAYVHAYERRGLSCAELGEALEAVQGMLGAYRSL